jgi:hypothetical protein
MYGKKLMLSRITNYLWRATPPILKGAMATSAAIIELSISYAKARLFQI